MGEMTPEYAAAESALITAYTAINEAERFAKHDTAEMTKHLVTAVRWLAESINAVVQMEKRRG